MQLAFPFPKFALAHRSLNNREMSNDDSGEKYKRVRYGKATRVTEDSPAAKGLADDRKDSSPAARNRRQALATRSSALMFGATLDDAAASRLTALEDAKKLRNKALRLLTTREHSREELMQKLARAKARAAHRNAEEKSRESAQQQKDSIEALVNDLASQGWQSDERYAEAMVRRLAGQASKRFIAEKLAQAGIKKDAAQVAIEAIDIEDADAATALWQRRFGDVPRDDRERQRQVRFLLARGFHLSEAFKIVPKLARQSSNED